MNETKRAKKERKMEIIEKVHQKESLEDHQEHHLKIF